MNKTISEVSKEYAYKCHNETNHTYDGKPYTFHLEMVVKYAKKYIYLIPVNDQETVIAGAYCHDSIEDTRQTRNDVAKATNNEIAEIAYVLTNEKGRNRKERANEKYYKGIRKSKYGVFVKLCDRMANAEYSYSKYLQDPIKANSMYDKYGAENDNFFWKLVKPEWYDFHKWLLILIIGKDIYTDRKIRKHKYVQMFADLYKILNKK